MPTSDLFIIAAGNGSRLKADIPKALVPITNEPCLTTTLKQVAHKFENVFVVTSMDPAPQEQWDAYFKNLHATYPDVFHNVAPVKIASGYGDGHATWCGIHAAECVDVVSDDVVIAWGDVFFPHAEIIDELLDAEYPYNGRRTPLNYGGTGIIPCVKEEKPYVEILTQDGGWCYGANFSKHGDICSAGWHDQSVFRFNKAVLMMALHALNASFWKVDHYITPGGELSLLHAFHYLHNQAMPASVYETKYPTLSFNTVEEVALIQTEINLKWKHKFKS